MDKHISVELIATVRYKKPPDSMVEKVQRQMEQVLINQEADLIAEELERKLNGKYKHGQ